MKIYQIINLYPYFVFSDDAIKIAHRYRLFIYNYYFYNTNNQLLRKKSMIKCIDTPFFSYTPYDLECITDMNMFLDFSTIDIYLLQIPYKFKNRNIYVSIIINYDQDVITIFDDTKLNICLLDTKYLCFFHKEKNSILDKYCKGINWQYYTMQLTNIFKSQQLLQELRKKDF